MESNNIDNFFRQYSSNADETPGDTLWQRIEAELPVGKLPNTSAKSGWLTKLFLLSVGILGIAAGVYIFSNKTVEKQVTPITTIPETTLITPEITGDTVKPKKAIVNKKKQQPTEPKKDYVKFRPVNKQKEKIISAYALKPGATVILQNATLVKEPMKITVQFNKKRTVITINEKVSQKVFDSIAQASVEQYKNNSGMQLIIKEPRSGTIFRTTFEPQMITYKLITTDTIKTINSLNQEVITFKTDTLKTIAPAGIMPRYHVNSSTTVEDTKKPKKQR